MPKEIGESFNPFVPDDTTRTDYPKYDPESYSIAAKVFVNTRTLLRTLPLEIEGFRTGGTVAQTRGREVIGFDDSPEYHYLMNNWVNTVTPFDPNVGYQITEEDYSQSQRLAKISQLLKEEQLPKDINNEFPLSFSSGIDYEHFTLIGESPKGQLANFYDGEYKTALQKLRLQVFFSNGLAYESNPDRLLFEDEGSVYFMKYYPIENGPLASLKGTNFGFYGQGVTLALPADFHRLSQIQTKLII